MTILAIDPGTTESAYVRLHDGRPVEFGKVPNHTLLSRLYTAFDVNDRVAIEMVQSFGMPVGREVFETVLWVGRFTEAWVHRQMDAPQLIYRSAVKQFHCHSARANDANIRAAIIDTFGGKEAAIGRKANPGPLYGIYADVWSALAIALTVQGRPSATPRDAIAEMEMV